MLDVAALVVDMLRRYFPRQLDRLEREKALFPGPHPLLLGGISVDDLAILLSGSDRNLSQASREAAGAAGGGVLVWRAAGCSLLLQGPPAP